MSSLNFPFGPAQSYSQPQAQIDRGVLARFFNTVYAWMAAGLGITAVVAYYVSTRTDALFSIVRPGVFVLLFVVQIVLVVTIANAVRRIGPPMATLLFLLYAAINGLTLSVIFVAYAHAAIASAFIVTAGMFLAMSLYGFVTRRDLTTIGSLLFMALLGLIIASIVSFFWHSSALTVAINYIGVLIFVGLTAYDTQRLKGIALETANDSALASRLAISGALILYLDFLNLFLFLLRIMGNRR